MPAHAYLANNTAHLEHNTAEDLHLGSHHARKYRSVPANLGNDIEGVGVIELPQPRHSHLREFQAVECAALFQHLHANNQEAPSRPMQMTPL